MPACFLLLIFFNDPHEKKDAQLKQSEILQSFYLPANLEQYPEGIKIPESLWLQVEKAGGRRPKPYVTNNSHSVVYYKPESKRANPGLDENGAYPIAPGSSLYCPVDGIVTPAARPGEIYRVPTGSSVIVDEDGQARPDNIIAWCGTLIGAAYYGNVTPPDPSFAKLANAKLVLYSQVDIKKSDQ